jgi:ribonuclease BN (tRNA processing enzyme)
MQIRVLGCSGSIAAGSRTTSFLVGEDLLIDAGTGVGDLSLAEMVRVDHIFITHSHLDHVLSIGLLADSVTRKRAQAGRPPVRVMALQETLDALRAHIFNGIIWPDFTCLPEPAHPVLALQAIALGERVLAGRHWVEALPALHTVPALGYAVWPADQIDPKVWVYSGDTGPNPAFWARLRSLRLGAVVIETAFRNDERALAEISQHLCPFATGTELHQLPDSAQVYITHIKPGEVEAVMAEVAAIETLHRVEALHSGQQLEVT